MKAERWQRIEELFGDALQTPSGQRRDFLDRACQGDDNLRQEVEALLAAHNRAGDFIREPAVEDALNLIRTPEPALDAGHRIGSYELVREIGRGGMGAVYLAARADDEFKKRVAIKVIKRGMDSEDILRRFRNERQILASLDHPNIARLLDGGTTSEGLPFFVMEFVEGLPLIDYCDSRRLSTVERLKLFRKICGAVQHAHQNLVVHRDLKPNNILVTAENEPKLLDFGIAKFLNPELFPQTIPATAPMMRMMTRDYASPEQVRGQPITTASDVYSLGVLLYKLLTGHHPYQFKTPLPQEAERVICETEPARPSDAVGRTEEVTTADGVPAMITPEAVGAARDSQPDRLRRQLSGDLDNIVLMAIRKEPRRRYQSVGEFSEDISRYLEGRPVTARGHAFGYRASKFIRRNRVAAAATIVVLLAILAGLIATASQARVAARERDQARREKAKAEAVGNFLQSILGAASPEQKGKDAKVLEVMNDAASRVDTEFAGQPDAKPRPY